MELGKIILNKRNKLGLSLRDLSDASDISATYISMIERGTIPSPRASRRVLEALGYDDIDIENILIKCGILPSDIVNTILSDPDNYIPIIRELGILSSMDKKYIDGVRYYLEVEVYED